MPKNHLTDEMIEEYGMDNGIYFATLDGAVFVNAILNAPTQRQREILSFAFLDYLFRGRLPSTLPKNAMGYWLNLKQSADAIRKGKATGPIRKARTERTGNIATDAAISAMEASQAGREMKLTPENAAEALRAHGHVF